VHATERFAAVMSRPDPEIALDEATLLVAAHAHPDLDLDAARGRLDDLAARAPADAEGLATYLFVEAGFAGNTDDYSDPRNSYLDDVLDRRLGIPITLSVLMIEVGRRLGVPLAGVGMPGHFLVTDGGDRWFDPFHHGQLLDEDGCRVRYTEVRGDTRFRPEYLAPVGARAIVSRILANLVFSLVRREPASAVWALRLRLLVPGLGDDERRAIARQLGSLGSFAESATALEEIGAEHEATAMRSRVN
jgi:regulator of sirC expression with transglutaminase-like and TPR domain